MPTFSSLASAARAYLAAKEAVLKSPYGCEVVQQRESPEMEFTEEVFLRESAWVILSAGIAERVVRSKFDAISRSFFQWESAQRIAADVEWCCRSALGIFAHRPKITAIARVSQSLATQPFDAFKQSVLADPFAALSRFPFIGPVTVFHLAKNLGVRVAKPDRHLSRLAVRYGYADANDLCSAVASFTGDRVDVVDTVFWRFATFGKTSEGTCARSKRL